MSPRLGPRSRQQPGSSASESQRRNVRSSRCWDAAMVTLADDIEAARELAKDDRDEVAMTRLGHEARQRLKKTGFSDLRSAFVKHGGSLTVPYLRLDKDIDKYIGACIVSSVGVGGEDVNFGLMRGLFEQLDSIFSQSASIRESAA